MSGGGSAPLYPKCGENKKLYEASIIEAHPRPINDQRDGGGRFLDWQMLQEG